jgi:hypothetical protein
MVLARILSATPDGVLMSGSHFEMRADSDITLLHRLRSHPTSSDE